MGHADDHGHAIPPGAGAASAGPHEIPPVPAARHITPAPEDFATTPPVPRLLWPVFWMALAVLVVLVVRARGWREVGHDAAPHEAPRAAPHAPAR